MYESSFFWLRSFLVHFYLWDRVLGAAISNTQLLYTIEKIADSVMDFDSRAVPCHVESPRSHSAIPRKTLDNLPWEATHPLLSPPSPATAYTERTATISTHRIL